MNCHFSLWLPSVCWLSRRKVRDLFSLNYGEIFKTCFLKEKNSPLKNVFLKMVLYIVIDKLYRCIMIYFKFRFPWLYVLHYCFVNATTLRFLVFLIEKNNIQCCVVKKENTQSSFIFIKDVTSYFLITLWSCNVTLRLSIHLATKLFEHFR